MSQDRAWTPEDLNVSRETFDRLCLFEALLRKWNPRINLVSRSSLEQVWSRHISDSIQVFRSIKAEGHWVDLGSGGGFPGMIVAIMAAEDTPDLRVTLIESDQRKSAFLRAAARECGIQCTVLSERIEAVQPQGADILSARALADLSDLLAYAARHLGPDGVALFPKGVTWKKELGSAREQWQFDYDAITNQSEPGAVILRIKGVSRV